MRSLCLPSGAETTTNMLDVSTFKINRTCAKFNVPPTTKQQEMIIF